MAEEKAATAERRSAAIAAIPDDAVDAQEDDGVVSGACGPFAAMCEAFGLLFRYPDLARVVVACSILFGSASMPWIVCLPELQSQVWGDKAGAYNSYLAAARSAVGALACPFFGRWIDRRGHKFGVVVVIVTNILMTNGALAVFGINASGLTAFFVVQTMNSVVGMNSSGCPAVFALISDVLPSEYLEIGFGLFFLVMAAANLIFEQIGSSLVRLVPDFPTLGLWFTLVMSLIALALLACVQGGGPQEVDEEDKDKPILDLLEPLRLAWRKRSLFYLCIIAAALTFPDIAGMGIGTQYLYHQLDDVGASTEKLQLATLLFSTYPNLVMMPVYGLVGALCRRFGPMLILKAWLPFCALAFTAPALLAVRTDNWAILVAGTGYCIPFSCYVPLQSLVIHVVPASRIGEAMGAVTSCKMIASIFAPVICGFAWTSMEKSGSDLYWTFWVVAGLLMLLAFPVTFLLEKRAVTLIFPEITLASWL